MKNYQKNSRNPSVPFSCMFEQCLSSVLDKTNKWHLTNHIWSLNLNLVFKPTSFNCVASCISSINIILPRHIHASYCCIALIVFFPCLSVLSPLSRRRSDDEFDDTDEELYYLQKCQASKTPLFILIQSHSRSCSLLLH